MTLKKIRFIEACDIFKSAICLRRRGLKRNELDTKSVTYRHKLILDQLAEDGRVLVIELAETLNVTPETIRRDLSKLESKKLLKKIHGGAINIQSKFEHEFEQRMESALDEKKAIALSASALIKPGDTLFIDFGTTTYEFADQVKLIDNLTIITNSPLIAKIVQDNPTCELILIGGQFISSRYECLGSIALQNIENLFADYAVIGAGAIDPQKGVMAPHIDEAAIARKMSQHSNKTIVLADSTKWQKHAVCRIILWDDVDFLVTCGTNYKGFNPIIREGVDVVFAKLNEDD